MPRKSSPTPSRANSGREVERRKGNPLPVKELDLSPEKRIPQTDRIPSPTTLLL
jgi:hypothetical protein